MVMRKTLLVPATSGFRSTLGVRLHIPGRPNLCGYDRGLPNLWLVKAEATELARTDAALRLFESEQAESVRGKLHEYVRSIIANEWPQLGSGVPDAETGSRIRELKLLALSLEAPESEANPLVGEVHERVIEIGEFRARRFLAAETEGMGYFWLLGFVGFTALLIQFGYYGNSGPGNLIVGVFCTMQATVFYIALVASKPFADPGAISSAMLVHSIELRELVSE